MNGINSVNATAYNKPMQGYMKNFSSIGYKTKGSIKPVDGGDTPVNHFS